MILIDSVFVNVGGTKVLLEYLLAELSNSPVKFFLLLDHRTENNLNADLSKSDYRFVSGYFERKKFYKERGKEFSKILCFGNIPPNYKIGNAEVFTYFHQQLFLTIPKDFTIMRKLAYTVKINLLKKLVSNSNKWLIQSPLMGRNLAKKYSIKDEDILVLPFYPPMDGEEDFQKIKNSFIFVSDATPHKNHYRLIDAFCRFYDETALGTLTLTIPEHAVKLLDYIKLKISNGYPVENIGFVKREDLYRQYSEHEFLIFPSLAESFGLGLVEAIDCSCKIIAADLLYTYEVCVPSLVFDPLKIESIFAALMKTQSGEEIPYAKKKVNNNIKMLIDILEKK